MGTMYSGFCENCGYGKDFHVGGGFLSMNLTINANTLPEEEKEKLLAMEKRKEIKRFVAENYVATCSHCHTLMEKTVIDVEDIVDVQYTFGEHCNTCGNKLTIYKNIDREKIECPKCKSRSVSFSPIGNWD